jgi:XTP/dITP diphosphohydrolase
LIVIASKNRGKLKEFAILFPVENGQGKLLTIDQIPDMPDCVEDGETFEHNANKKALEAGRFANLVTFADDSGIEIEALNNRPGVYSARYAGEHGNDEANNKKVLAELTTLNLKTSPAKFVSVISLYIPKLIVEQLPKELQIKYQKNLTTQGEILLDCRGELTGKITFSIRGENGFGYDPIFEVGDTGRTLAEFPSDEKSQFSHRAQALTRLKQENAELLTFLSQLN